MLPCFAPAGRSGQARPCRARRRASPTGWPRPNRRCASWLDAHRASRPSRVPWPCCRRRGELARRCSSSATRPSPGTRPPCRRPCPPATGGSTIRPGCCRRRTRPWAGRWPPTASPATAATRPSGRASCCRRGAGGASALHDRRGDLARARPGQHARQRSRARPSWPRPWSRSPARFGAECQRHRRRRPARGQLPGRPRRRPRQRPRTAPDRPALGRSGGTQGDAGRQGRLLRHRRARHQAVQRHADDEEGHGRRRADAGAGPLRHGAGPAGAAAPADPGGREQHRRRGVPARATCSPCATAARSRSPTPTPRAG